MWLRDIDISAPTSTPYAQRMDVIRGLVGRGSVFSPKRRFNLFGGAFRRFFRDSAKFVWSGGRLGFFRRHSLFCFALLAVFSLAEKPAPLAAQVEAQADSKSSLSLRQRVEPVMAAPASPAAEAGSVVGLMAANAGTGETAGLEAAVGAGQLPQIPRPLSAYSMAHLYELISREPPLTRNEIVIYRKNLSAIVALNADPAGLGPILEATGLTQQRLTYVVTKIGVGLSYLLYPESPKLRHLPDYLKPSSLEEELIADQLDELVNDFHKLYAPEVKPRKRAVSRKRP